MFLVISGLNEYKIRLFSLEGKTKSPKPSFFGGSENVYTNTSPLSSLILTIGRLIVMYVPPTQGLLGIVERLSTFTTVVPG